LSGSSHTSSDLTMLPLWQSRIGLRVPFLG
jgi:hypothetical protein